MNAIERQLDTAVTNIIRLMRLQANALAALERRPDAATLKLAAEQIERDLYVARHVLAFAQDDWRTAKAQEEAMAVASGVTP